jgi:hypothetical protein
MYNENNSNNQPGNDLITKCNYPLHTCLICYLFYCTRVLPTGKILRRPSSIEAQIEIKAITCRSRQYLHTWGQQTDQACTLGAAQTPMP